LSLRRVKASIRVSTFRHLIANFLVMKEWKGLWVSQLIDQQHPIQRTFWKGKDYSVVGFLEKVNINDE
jgi:hypothetical protein